MICNGRGWRGGSQADVMLAYGVLARSGVPSLSFYNAL